MAKTTKTTENDTAESLGGGKLPSLTKKYLRELLETKLSRFYGTTPKEANKDQIYRALLLAVKAILSHKRTEFKKNVTNQEGKKIYYLCMEFLIGKSLRNNLMNLGIADKYESILTEMGFDLEELYDVELTDSGIKITCRECGAKRVIPTDSLLAANAFLNVDSITLE